MVEEDESSDEEPLINKFGKVCIFYIIFTLPEINKLFIF